MIAVEAGDAAADKILEMLSSQIAHSEFAQYLGGDGISAEELTALRQNIQDKVQEQMGRAGDALKAIDDATPEWYRKLEEGVQERLAAALGDDFRDVLANFEVPESFADQFCEAIVE